VKVKYITQLICLYYLVLTVTSCSLYLST